MNSEYKAIYFLYKLDKTALLCFQKKSVHIPNLM